MQPNQRELLQNYVQDIVKWFESVVLRYKVLCVIFSCCKLVQIQALLTEVTLHVIEKAEVWEMT